jgi:hypothetical protein
MCGVNFLYNTWFAGGRSTYICGLQKDKSCIGYMQFAVEKTTYVHGFPSKVNHVSDFLGRYRSIQDDR